jgi:hypothetical protein
MAVLAKIDRLGTERGIALFAWAAVRLMKTFAMQVEVFRRLRHGGQQFVRVGHVHVNDGGQAVIGNVKSRIRKVGDVRRPRRGVTPGLSACRLCSASLSRLQAARVFSPFPPRCLTQHRQLVSDEANLQELCFTAMPIQRSLRICFTKSLETFSSFGAHKKRAQGIESHALVRPT